MMIDRLLSTANIADGAFCIVDDEFSIAAGRENDRSDRHIAYFYRHC